MKRVLLVIVVLLIAGGAVWFFTGGPERVARQRIESELVARGLPQPMAECMATRMSEQLSIAQLRKLEALKPEAGEADVPMTVAGVLERVRRVGDPEVVEVTATSAAICAFGGI
ncbi:hypothetical protein [Qipengyuania soli]|uniref:Uncharacterized protein n=1 Tax=Qipengyuania soli TaxID=2782568 RepID=A0A7S8IT18_9SPHN|nr:hypothetical protein [Qipengyuania soli]QPC99513.1 hypothetical protein IRL76_02780 [Qipengyuania soli]